MNADKIYPATTTRPTAQNTTVGKSELVKDEKATLVRPSGLPSFLRKTVVTGEEEKEKKLLAIQRLKMQQQQPVGYKNMDVR